MQNAANRKLLKPTWHRKRRDLLVLVDGHFGGESFKLILTDDVQLLEVLHFLLGNTETHD